MSAKIHTASDALGLPVRLIGTPGRRNDIALARDLIDGFEADAVIAGKAYDADALIDKIAEMGADVVIPPKRDRKTQRPYDKHLDKERNVMGLFFCKFKQCGRVATRSDKLLANLMGFAKLATAVVWLK